MAWTDDAAADFERHDAEQERKLAKLPICSECGEHIQDDFLYDINGELICPQCLNDNYRKMTDDYME